MNYLVVIDMQKDFIDGSLGSPEALAVLPRVLQRVRSFEGEVLFTRDTHGDNYMETSEGKNLPVPHCIKGTPGWELADELESVRIERGCTVFDKPTFGSTELAEWMLGRYKAGELESVTLCGVCTDICVVSNALLLKANMPELPIYVDPYCCAGTSPENHSQALNTMKMCQIGLAVPE